MALQARKKQIEFTNNNPLTVNIEFNMKTKEWDIQPESPKHDADMHKRLHLEKDPVSGDDLETSLDKEWDKRRAQNASLHPHFIEQNKKNPGSHTPIPLREGEVVEFFCKQGFAFEIWADRDSGVAVYPGTPSNPFGWQSAQSVPAGGRLKAPVQATPSVGGIPTAPGPTEQRFYKFTAWVHTSDGLYVADPDGSCDR